MLLHPRLSIYPLCPDKWQKILRFLSATVFFLHLLPSYLSSVSVSISEHTKTLLILQYISFCIFNEYWISTLFGSFHHCMLHEAAVGCCWVLLDAVLLMYICVHWGSTNENKQTYHRLKRLLKSTNEYVCLCVHRCLCHCARKSKLYANVEIS